MSIKIPDKISREEFNKLTNKKLNTSDFRQYISIIKENYKKPRGGTEYFLKEGLSEQVLIRLDYVFKRIGDRQFDSLEEIARYFRMLLDEKKYILLFAYNGTGKTRLSAEFKKIGQRLIEDTEEKTADTLYYNAFTEDLFYWDNDLENDTDRFLKLNSDSRFFVGLKELEMESRIRPFYTDTQISISRLIMIIIEFAFIEMQPFQELMKGLKILRYPGEKKICKVAVFYD